MRSDLLPALVISAALHGLLCVSVLAFARPTPKRFTDKPLVVQLMNPPAPSVQRVTTVERSQESVDSRLLERLTKFLRDGRKKLLAQSDPTPTPTTRVRPRPTSTPNAAEERATPAMPVARPQETTQPFIPQNIQLGDAGFQYSYYVAALQRTLTQNWDPPPEAGQGELGSEVICKFRINKDGSISGVQIVQSSGRKALDSSAQMAAIRSSPFLPLPDDYRKGFLDVTVRFSAEQIWENQ